MTLKKPLICAPDSAIRAQLLRSLALDFGVVPAQCDESLINMHFLLCCD